MTKRVALVTGGSRGIGRGIALKLAGDYHVAISDLASQEKQALETVEEIKKLGVESIFIVADSSKRDEIFRAVRITYEQLGGFDTIVNNAGITLVKPVLEITEEDLTKVMDVNVGGTLWGIQAAAAKFEELGKGGKIINAGSIASYMGMPMMSAYSTSKFGIRALTQAAAKELGPKKITVNSYCPGCVLTPLMYHVDEMMTKYTGSEKGATIQASLDGIALGRTSEPEDVGDLVSFLASEKADYITGQCILVDGGMVYP